MFCAVTRLIGSRHHETITWIDSHHLRGTCNSSKPNLQADFKTIEPIPRQSVSHARESRHIAGTATPVPIAAADFELPTRTVTATLIPEGNKRAGGALRLRQTTTRLAQALINTHCTISVIDRYCARPSDRDTLLAVKGDDEALLPPCVHIVTTTIT